jgi:hypothetical protein
MKELPEEGGEGWSVSAVHKSDNGGKWNEGREREIER